MKSPIKPTSAPRRRRKAERGDEIIAAGIKTFAEHGYANTRLEDVARRAGIGKSTLYLYFESKEAIFLATMERQFGSTFDELDALVDNYTGSSEALLQLVLTRAYEHFVLSDTLVLLRIVIAEGSRFPELSRAFFEREMSSGRYVLERIVERGVENGEFRPGAAQAFPRLLVAPTISAAIWRMCFDTYEPVDIDAWILAHIDLLLNGLRA